MHVTAQQPNRRQRRLAKFGAREVVREAPRRRAKVYEDRPLRAYWRGFCDKCLKPAPHVYTLLWEKVSPRRGLLSAQTWCYTCYVSHFELRPPIEEADASEIPVKSSPSAVAIEWVENHHRAGVNIELHERDSLADDDPTGEIELLASLRAYLAALPESEQQAREARYFEIMRMWGERRYRRRRWQWLAAEFPGWMQSA